MNEHVCVRRDGMIAGNSIRRAVVQVSSKLCAGVKPHDAGSPLPR